MGIAKTLKLMPLESIKSSAVNDSPLKSSSLKINSNNISEKLKGMLTKKNSQLAYYTMGAPSKPYNTPSKYCELKQQHSDMNLKSEPRRNKPSFVGVKVQPHSKPFNAITRNIEAPNSATSKRSLYIGEQEESYGCMARNLTKRNIEIKDKLHLFSQSNLEQLSTLGSPKKSVNDVLQKAKLRFSNSKGHNEYMTQHRMLSNSYRKGKNNIPFKL